MRPSLLPYLLRGHKPHLPRHGRSTLQAIANRAPYSTSPSPSLPSNPTPISSTSTSDDLVTPSTSDSPAPVPATDSTTSDSSIPASLSSDSPTPGSSTSESSAPDSTPDSAPDSPPDTKGPYKWRDYLIRARQKYGSQKPTVIQDTLSPTHSYLLSLSLKDHLFKNFTQKFKAVYPRERDMIDNVGKLTLPQGHHLVYFPLQMPPSQLMADGTDPGHFPGEPFTRRMWAGGELKFLPGWEEKLRLDGRRAVCVETVVKQPVMKWENVEGKEKVFVDVKRVYYANGEEADWAMHATEERAAVHEVRKLVFMREPEHAPEGSVKEAEVGRVVKANKKISKTFVVKPDPALLFHFSALTYNAHAIHLDPDYARNREGYKERLVHGPLTVVLMMQAVRSRLETWPPTKNALKEGQEMPYIKSFTYSNLAPLYVNEEMRICLGIPAGEDKGFRWDVWIEGPDGGLAVKGHAITTGFQNGGKEIIKRPLNGRPRKEQSRRDETKKIPSM